MNATPHTDVRAAIDTLVEDLRARLAAPGTSLLPLLTTMSRFGRDSLANQLIYAQRLNTTHLLG